MSRATASATLVFFLITFAINIYLVFRGLSAGIERFCRAAMPAMGICALIVLVRVLTLPDTGIEGQNVAAGLNFMWNPEWDALSNPQTWLAACGQIFFSLSVGFGVIINYSSYMRKKDDVVLSGLTASATNEFFEVALGGLITLTAAVVFLGVAETKLNTGGTFSTGFTALPVVFAHMPAGRFFGFVWFFMLFLAAITSSLSMLQPTKAFFQEALDLSPKAATTVVASLCIAGNLFVLYFSEGLTALNTLDFWVGTFMIFVVAGTQIIVFGWVFGVDRGFEEAPSRRSDPHPELLPLHHQVRLPDVPAGGLHPASWSATCRTARIRMEPSSRAGSPRSREDGTIQIAMGVILATIIMLMVVTAMGAKRWRAAGWTSTASTVPTTSRSRRRE